MSGFWLDNKDCSCDPAVRSRSGVVTVDGVEYCKYCRSRVKSSRDHGTATQEPAAAQTQPVGSEGLIYCTSCGAGLASDVRFCSFCGHPISVVGEEDATPTPGQPPAASAPPLPFNDRPTAQRPPPLPFNDRPAAQRPPPPQPFNAQQHTQPAGTSQASVPGEQRKRGGFWFVIIPIGAVIGLAALALGYVTSFGTDHPGTAAKTVTYTASGTAAGGVVTMRMASGISQRDAGSLPASYTASLNPGAPVVMSIQNSGASGSVSCTITVDGQQVATNTSTAAYGIAQCSGTVPLL